VSRLPRRARALAVAIWIVVPVIVGGTRCTTCCVTRGIKEFKFRVAQHDAGLGPEASLPDLMAVTVFDATWIGLLFASIVALAGFVTIRLLDAASTEDPMMDNASPDSRLERLDAPPKAGEGAARRRDAARRAAVAVGPVPDHRAEARILHLIDRLGIDTADIGLPGAGPHVVARRRAARAGDRRPAAAREGRTARPGRWHRRHPADRRDLAAGGDRRSSAAAFIGSSPLRRYAEGWTLEQLLKRLTEEAITFAVGEGLPVMYVTEDTTRADPDTLRALYSTAIRAGASRVCIADTVGHATPAGRRGRPLHRAVVEECGGGVGIDWHGHRDRDFAIGNTLAALDAGATRLHGTAIGIGERVGQHAHGRCW
jgi:hypothetical protein